MTDIVKLVARVGDREITVRGRDAETLHRLIEAGDQGVSGIERVGPRLSHYIFKLRRSGFGIVTFEEKHGGAFAGYHGRYKLISQVEVIGREFAS